MTIEEIRTEKQKLESELTRMLAEFELKTSCKITAIEQKVEIVYGPGPSPRKVKLELKI